MVGFAIVTDPVLPVVKEGIATSEDKANQSYEDARTLMDDMQDLVNTLSNIPQIVATLAGPQSSVAGFVMPDRPEEPDGIDSVQFPSPPPDPETGTVGEITLSTAPTFTEAAPTTNNIAAPAPFSRAVPTEPALADHDLPVKPSNALPTAPTARELTLPTAPNIITVNFEGVVPGALSAPPNTTFNWQNEAYASDLQTAIKEELLDLVRNVRQTGLTDAVRQQLRDKARERVTAEYRGLKKNVIRQSAAMGWNMPQGDEWIKVRQGEEQAKAAIITEYRSEDLIDAQLEQANFQFAYSKALELEGQLIGLHNAEQQREFEAARYTIEAAISLYGLEVQYYNAGVAMYETQARVYQARLQAQLTEVEVYKAQLEGQRLISDLNRQDVELYKAKIDAILATFELYKSELEGVKTLMQADALKLQRFEAQVRAYAEEVRAKSLENDVYKTQIDAEKIKTDIYVAKTSAYNSLMQGFKIETDAKIAKQESDIKIAYDVPLEVAKQKTEIFKSTIAAKAEQIKALTSIFETRSRIFDSEVKGEASRVEAEVSIYENEVKKLIADAEINIEAVKGNISTLLAQKEMLIGVQKTIAQVKAQLAASFGSAVNYSAGIHSGVSQSVGYSYSGSAD
jgi:hypothetical protein